MAATIIVFGATSPTGVELCRRLRREDRYVIAAVRPTSDHSQLAALDVDCRKADAMDPEQVLKVLHGVGEKPAVVSLLGGEPTRKSAVVDSQGNINVIDAAVAADAGRFVLVTSIGCNESYPALVWVPRIILRHNIREKSKAEAYLKDSGLAWTIVRPGRLTKLRRKPTGRGILIEHALAAGPITRADLAGLIRRALDSDRAIGKTYTASDSRSARILGGVEVVPATL